MRSTIAAKQGIKAGLFRSITFWPFPEKQIKPLSWPSSAKAFVVPEMNLGMCTFEVERYAKGNAPSSAIFRVDGEPINPDQILDKDQGGQVTMASITINGSVPASCRTSGAPAAVTASS